MRQAVRLGDEGLQVLLPRGWFGDDAGGQQFGIHAECGEGRAAAPLRDGGGKGAATLAERERGGQQPRNRCGCENERLPTRS